jgi:hypothetical protein
MVCDQYAKTAFPEVVYELLGCPSRQSGLHLQRLVQENKVRLCCKRPCNLTAAAFAARQRKAFLVDYSCEVQLFEKLVPPLHKFLCAAGSVFQEPLPTFSPTVSFRNTDASCAR